MRARELLLKIMAVLAKVGTLHEQLSSVLVDPCLYYYCTMHQALAALRSLCTEGCARAVRSTCVGVRNEFIWTAATVLFAQVWTGYFDAYCTHINTRTYKNIYTYTYTHTHMHIHTHTHDTCTHTHTLPHTANWEIFVVKIFSMGCCNTKIKRTKIFRQQNIYGMKCFLHENLEQSV